MANQVKVTSIEALGTFRAGLIIFLTDAHRSVDEVQDEVRRTRDWLQNDRRPHWEGQLRRWRKLLDQAQGEYMSARLSGLRDSTVAQEMAVLKAKRHLAEAEEKLRVVKIWSRDFDHVVMPMLKRIEGLRQYLDYDLPKALAYLVQTQNILEGYTEVRVPSQEPSANAPAPLGEPL